MTTANNPVVTAIKDCYPCRATGEVTVMGFRYRCNNCRGTGVSPTWEMSDGSDPAKRLAMTQASPPPDEMVNLVGMLVQAAREREAACRLPDCIPGADRRLAEAKAKVFAALQSIGPMRGWEPINEALDWAADYDPELVGKIRQRIEGQG